jgi:hypothetical protein
LIVADETTPLLCVTQFPVAFIRQDLFFLYKFRDKKTYDVATQLGRKAECGHKVSRIAGMAQGLLENRMYNATEEYSGYK